MTASTVTTRQSEPVAKLLWDFDEMRVFSGPAAEVFGHKAASLAALHADGFPVPAGGCVATWALDDFLRDNGLHSLVQRLVLDLASHNGGRRTCRQLCAAIRAGAVSRQLEAELAVFTRRFAGCRFAVRSSGTREDGRESSFAGLYRTTLNVTGERALADAIKDCWASLFEPRVLSYCRDRGVPIDALKMGVLIQVMVAADKSGVSFSVDPIEGLDTQVVIEATRGLGEALVSGAVTPDRYSYDWHDRREIRRSVPDATAAAVLHDDEVAEVATLSARVQAFFGTPVDIEWASADSRLFLVQARPITAIAFRGVQGQWTTADFKDGGVSSDVCTPLMWSLYDFVLERTMPSYLKRLGLIDRDLETRWGTMLFGRGYWNVGAVKDGMKRLPGFVERTFDEGLGIDAPYEGPGYRSKTTPRTVWRGLRVLHSLKRSFADQLERCAAFEPAQRARLAELDRMRPERWSDAELLDFYPRLIRQEYLRSEGAYFDLVYDNANVASLFRDAFAKVQGSFNYLSLISGLTNVSHLDQGRDLWRTVQAIRRDPAATAYWLNTPVPTLVEDWREGRTGLGMTAARAHVEAFKHHSARELDLSVPRFGEDPSLVFESLQQLLTHPVTEDPAALAQGQQRRFEDERRRYLAAVPFGRRRRMAKRLAQVRTFLRWREALRDLSTCFYYQLRRFTLELAARLCRRGELERPEDIFCLSIELVLGLCDGSVSGPVAREAVQRNRLYYRSFRNFDNPNEIGSRHVKSSAPVDVGGTVFGGIGGSPGTFEGPVKVIGNILEAGRLEAGDILVTQFTDPGWTPKFGLLSAVVTETGGLLSHAAVISREYGIPAVLAVPGITHQLRDGQRVRVDGDRGRVTVLEANAP